MALWLGALSPRPEHHSLISRTHIGSSQPSVSLVKRDMMLSSGFLWYYTHDTSTEAEKNSPHTLNNVEKLKRTNRWENFSFFR